MPENNNIRQNRRHIIKITKKLELVKLFLEKRRDVPTNAQYRLHHSERRETTAVGDGGNAVGGARVERYLAEPSN